MRTIRNCNVVVCGGAGFIGSHTVVELANAGYTPIIVDDLSNSRIEILGQLERILGTRPAFHQLDLCDRDAVSAMLQAEGTIHGVIHFAASKAVGESVQLPLKYYRNNLLSLLNILELLAGQGPAFVFSSSCTVYGQPEQLPVTEDAPIQKALSPYGNTKQIAEEILQDLANAGTPLRTIALRYFNPVGAHPSALIGELPIGIPQNLVPFITQTAIGKRKQLTVFGDDYHTVDGTCVRDFIHVVDLARAHVAAIRKLAPQPGGYYNVYNIGTGIGYSVLQAIQTFERVTHVKLPHVIGARRPGDIEKVWGQVDKARNELGWQAELDLATMMDSAWKWEQYLATNPF